MHTDFVENDPGVTENVTVPFGVIVIPFQLGQMSQLKATGESARIDPANLKHKS